MLCLLKVDCINNNIEGTFSPFKLKLAELGIVAAQSLAICKDSLIPIRLINLKENKIDLYKNTLLGYFDVCINDIGNINLVEKKLTMIMALLKKLIMT